MQPSVVGAGGESATPPSVTVVSAEDAAAASARVEGVYTFKGLLMDRKKQVRRDAYWRMKERSHLDDVSGDDATGAVDDDARHGDRVKNALAAKQYRARGREAAAAAPADRKCPLGVRICQKRTRDVAQAFVKATHDLSSPERAKCVNKVLTHQQVNPMRIKAGVRTAGEAELDSHVLDNIAAHASALRPDKGKTSMAAKRVLVTLATTASTGLSKGGDGLLLTGVAKRLKLGRKRLVSSNGSRRLRAACKGQI